ncbi:uncharacterized protein LOC121650993 [Melanotaenia boesemani]|uniref:uncharacterized protein LOC121650993 n=1 Tax=Melanotaenia boesemani TaxID=1250792 RepID=UPI001C046853|nr:uncharacterized protein LOC121650993 [Melanotaenia boesemani]
MPRKGKRSQGQTKRWRALADPKVVECVSKLLVDPCSSSLGKTVGQHQQPEAPPPRGTGWRYRVNKWPLSVSGRSHKLVIPAEFPGKEFILLVGDSHLRSFADGVVPMPKGNLSFGFMATPGACADQLCAEMKHVALSRDPDLVVVLAPSNNLTVSRTIQEAGAAFRRYLETVCDRWTNVVVADFIPRLTVAKGYQDMMRHEFQRVAADFRLTYWHWADHFPLNSVDLWSHDGVHLGDDKGMPRLADVIWNSTYEHLETLAHKMPRMASPPPSTRVSPRIVVKRNAQVPRRPTTEWTCVGSSMKVAAAAALREKFHLPLKPVYFSHKGVPSDKRATPGVSTRTRIQKQVCIFDEY